eukprot:s935_g16.t1
MSGSESAPETGQVPNQLALLVPTFDPSTDSVEIWSSKVELLLAAWPQGKILELVTRLILGCKGTAYQKLQLHQKELLKNDTAAVKRVVELVGGTWGAIPLEKKFELVEKALYRSNQKSDETSDSFLSRTDVIWTELLAKGTSLAEIQSYVILRGSRLNADDKKRVIVESGAEQGGALELTKVRAAIRMLGSGFFQDMTGSKREKGLRTYDHTAFTMDEITEEETQEAFWVQDELDDNTLEALAAEDDDDAALVLQFEDAISKGFGKKGKNKGKGKGSLASRIANSYCRICMKKGHWKNECPSRNASGSAASTAATSVPTSFAVVDDIPEALVNMAISEDPWTTEYERGKRGKFGLRTKTGVRSVKGSCSHGILEPLKERLRKVLTSDKLSCAVPVQRSNPCPSMMPDHLTTDQVESPEIPSLFATSGTVGVVDLGASQTVIGSEQVPDLLAQLPEWVKQQTRRCACHLVFRFGNHQTLVSKHALVLPLGQLTFRIAVVEGRTPFLISSAFLKGLKAVIDTDQETLYSRTLGKFLQLHKSNKNLFLMDINQLWETEALHASVQLPVTDRLDDIVSEVPKIAEDSDVSKCQVLITCLSLLDRVFRPTAHTVFHQKPLLTMSIAQKLKQYRNASEEQCSEERMKAIYQMTIDELEKEVISFGKAKVGVPFTEAFQDGRWTDWFVTTYEKSQKEGHAKYVAYVSKRLDAEINMDAIERKSAQKSDQPVTPKITKQSQPPMLSKKEKEDFEDESLSEFIPIMESQSHLEEQVMVMQEENNNLRGRMTQIEMALQDLIKHVKNLTPNN